MRWARTGGSRHRRQAGGARAEAEAGSGGEVLVAQSGQPVEDGRPHTSIERAGGARLHCAGGQARPDREERHEEQPAHRSVPEDAYERQGVERGGEPVRDRRGGERKRQGPAGLADQAPELAQGTSRRLVEDGAQLGRRLGLFGLSGAAAANTDEDDAADEDLLLLVRRGRGVGDGRPVGVRDVGLRRGGEQLCRALPARDRAGLDEGSHHARGGVEGGERPPARSGERVRERAGTLGVGQPQRAKAAPERAEKLVAASPFAPGGRGDGHLVAVDRVAQARPAHPAPPAGRIHDLQEPTVPAPDHDHVEVSGRGDAEEQRRERARLVQDEVIGGHQDLLRIEAELLRDLLERIEGCAVERGATRVAQPGVVDAHAVTLEHGRERRHRAVHRRGLDDLGDQPASLGRGIRHRARGRACARLAQTAAQARPFQQAVYAALLERGLLGAVNFAGAGLDVGLDPHEIDPFYGGQVSGWRPTARRGLALACALDVASSAVS
jgi:hypothetical protein